MNLQKQFESFVNKQKLDEKGASLREFLVKHRGKVRAGFAMAKAIKSFAVDKTPLAFLEGTFEVLEGVARFNSDRAFSYFSYRNGWVRLFNDNLNDLLAPALKDFDYRTISFEYDSSSVKIYTTPIGEISYIKSLESYSKETDGIYFKHNEVERSTVIDFLITQTIKQLNSDIISLNNEDEDNVSLVGEPVDFRPSRRLDNFILYIQKCFDLGIGRSFIFYGPPGTGKSSLSQSIVSKLKLKTLIYKDETYDNINTFFFLIEKLGIQAVILDDFDQIEKSNKLLRMLERLNRQVKLVIGLVNSMQDFHPAVIRPGRFSEIRKIDTMDEDVVKDTLGDLCDVYYEKVRIWPIAYINEFVVRSKLYPAEELEQHYEELNTRVKKQLKELAESNDPLENSSDEEPEQA